jgi:hypothetical protein
MKAIVGAKFDVEDKKLLVRVCKDRREDLSDFVRRAVMGELGRLSYLPESEKKALGIPIR